MIFFGSLNNLLTFAVNIYRLRMQIYKLMFVFQKQILTFVCILTQI